MDKTCATIWFYSKDVSGFASVSGSKKVLATNGGSPSAFKHWAVVVGFKSKKDPSRLNKRILYDANCDPEGFLLARELFFGQDEEEDWKSQKGFSEKNHGDFPFNEALAKSYCSAFNERKIKYVATSDNCQMFVNEFLANLLPDSTISLPPLANETFFWLSGISSALLDSIGSVGSAALIEKALLAHASRTGVSPIIQEVLKDISLNGIGEITVLSEGPIKELMAKEGQHLILSVFGEMTENMFNAGRGAFSWLNLIQIPVEMIVCKLMKSNGFTNVQAFKRLC